MLSDVMTRALTMLPPEEAHKLTVALLKSPFAPRQVLPGGPQLETKIAGLTLPNPVGLAAGFDKNAEVPDPLLRLGFGFVEVGAVTPLPQPGNPKPRVFRLRSEAAIINRYGFNNDGLAVIAARLAARKGSPGVVGINLGANKNSDDRAADYVQGLMALEPHVSFLTVNVSSPNTAGLRDLQGKGALDDLLRRVMVARVLGKPVFVKVAPDLSDEDLADISASAIAAKVDGVIVSNTTVSREGVSGRYREEAGGLSGRPLMNPSTAVLRAFAQEARGRLTFIGVGGVSSAKDVATKLKAGASAVQLYTALVYKGPRLVKRIIKELPSVLHAEGFSSVHDAVGADISG